MIERKHRPVKVAFVAKTLKVGGVGMFLLRLSRYLHQHGFEVDIVTTEERGASLEKAAEYGVAARHIPGSDLPWRLPIDHSRRIGAQLRKGAYDVVFLNHARWAQAALRMLPENVIAIPIGHGDFEPGYWVGSGNANAWNVAIGVSPKICRVLRQWAKGRPIIEIMHGVEIPGDDYIANRARFAGGRLRALFIGRLAHEDKGVLWLPRILKECIDRGLDITLTLAGEGPDRAEFEEAIGRLGVGNRACLVGALGNRETYKLLGESHVLLMPSQFEGLGIVAQEAQACGCVPIASRLPGATEVTICDGQTGLLVEPGDVRGFADALQKVAGDASEWARLSRNGRSRARSAFRIETMGKAYVRVIEDALEGRYPLPQPRAKGFGRLDLRLLSWTGFLPPPVKKGLGALLKAARRVTGRRLVGSLRRRSLSSALPFLPPTRAEPR